MAFMQKQITDKRMWLEIDGNRGITVVDAADAPELLPLIEAAADETDELDGDALEELQEAASVYYDGRVEMVCKCVGYGARLSAPGYMDCTDWTVYDTQEEAEAGLNADYGDEDDEL